MQIDEVEVSGQKFQIVSEKTTGISGTEWKYSVIIDGVENSIGAKVTSDVIETLEFIPNIDVQKELEYILLKEIKAEIFAKIHPQFYKLMTEYGNIFL